MHHVTPPAPSVRDPYALPEMPRGRAMTTVDERLVRASAPTIFAFARDVERWPAHLPHYRWVRFHERARDGGGVVEMAAWRPFGPLGWPTWWVSEMAVHERTPAIRFRHVRGITTGMDVEWTFTPQGGGTLVRIVHVWNGPAWPVIGVLAAAMVIGPVFVHGIASRTLRGLAIAAERMEGSARGG
ncbi:MAG: SRPBCC family protein [Gemmatimonadaceae bacterium]|nr:SRPBCC family protein [Gemmatimonadaceae bacterium]